MQISNKCLSVIFVALVLVFLLGGYISRYEYSIYGNEIKKLKVEDNAFHVEVVSDSLKMEKGLGGRIGICDSCGMMFVFDKPRILSFWMKDMQFPLDIIWISENKIVYVEKNIQKNDASIFKPNVVADKVLEINAGLVDSLNIRVGQKIEF